MSLSEQKLNVIVSGKLQTTLILRVSVRPTVELSKIFQLVI